MTFLFAGNMIFEYDTTTDDGMTRLYTFLFNTYVMMQIFNEINARKIYPDEINVFKGFFNNPFFLFIIFISVVVQITMVEVGGDIVGVTPLSWWEYSLSIGIGAFSIIWGNFIFSLNNF